MVSGFQVGCDDINLVGRLGAREKINNKANLDKLSVNKNSLTKQQLDYKYL
jgi:hypothetical protein